MTLRNYSSTAAQTTLSGPVDGSTTTLVVSATTGFPATPFVLAIDAGAAAQELVLVTNVAGTTLTVTRAFDSTVAASHNTGAVVAHSHAAIDFREANTHVNATSGAHGATGSLVGTTDTQTLSNKTVTLGSNSVSGTKSQFNTALTDDDFAYASDVTPRGTWQDWAPALTAGGTLGNGSSVGRFVQNGKTIHFWGGITLGSTSTVTGTLGVSLPVTARDLRYAALQAHLADAGVTDYDASARLTTTTRVSIYPRSANGSPGSNPFAFGPGDIIEVRGTYEAA